MRRALFLVVLATGCEDFGKLQSDFCSSARVSHPVDAGAGKSADDVVARALLCDDFEKAIDPSKWSMDFVGTTLAIEQFPHPYFDNTSTEPTYAFRGHGVLHAVAPTGGVAQLVETSVTSSHRTPAIRAFVWPGIAVTGATELISLVDANATPIRQLSLVNGVPTLFDAASGRSAAGNVQFSRKDWNCVDFFSNDTELGFSDANGNGAFLAGLPTPLQAAATHIGPTGGDPTSANSSEMWIDEVIIDDADIGCGP